MYTNIKNIVFDFGGVLIDIDYHLTNEALGKLLGVSFTSEDIPTNVLKSLHAFETGNMAVETFLWNLQILAKNTAPQGKELINAWNAMLMGWNPKKFDFLLALRKKYNIYLLSNTNELHLDWVYDDLKRVHNIQDFDSRYFDKTYYSHLIGKRKPNEEIYAYVTDDVGLILDETIFIDDLKPNIDAAKSFGWNTYHHNPADDLIAVFEKKLKLL